jgi:hypothetical protein
MADSVWETNTPSEDFQIAQKYRWGANFKETLIPRPVFGREKDFTPPEQFRIDRVCAWSEHRKRDASGAHQNEEAPFSHGGEEEEHQLDAEGNY